MVSKIQVINTEKTEAPPIPEPSTTQTTNDVVQLVKRAANGDVEAFGELYDIYLSRIYRYVFYQVKVKMLAEDLTEDIFLKAWKALGKYRGNGPSFQTWLYRIANNHIIDYFRTNHTIAHLDQEISINSYSFQDTGDPSELAETSIMNEKILEHVSCLPFNQRQIIILKFMEGLDNRDIEQITGKKLNSLYMQLSKE
ncbi:MAG: sigma-70 family RNA polymerase sigma factor [Dehalococcoidia bacterium]